MAFGHIHVLFLTLIYNKLRTLSCCLPQPKINKRRLGIFILVHQVHFPCCTESEEKPIWNCMNDPIQSKVQQRRGRLKRNENKIRARLLFYENTEFVALLLSVIAKHTSLKPRRRRYSYGRRILCCSKNQFHISFWKILKWSNSLSTCKWVWKFVRYLLLVLLLKFCLLSVILCGIFLLRMLQLAKSLGLA